MASLFSQRADEVRLLDAGAGVGRLTAAFVEHAVRRSERPKRIVATAYEVDDDLLPYLNDSLQLCGETCIEAGVEFETHVYSADFIELAVEMLDGGLFAKSLQQFNAAI